MGGKLNSFTKLALGGLAFTAGSMVQIFLGKIVDKRDVEFYGEIVGDFLAEKLSKLFFGVSGMVTAKGMEQIRTNREFRKIKFKEYDQDVLDLSKLALSLTLTKGIGKSYKEEIKKIRGELPKDIETKIDEQIKKLNCNSWEFSDIDAIRFVDLNDNSIDLLNPETGLDTICDELSFDKYFKENFGFWFGELLKRPENNKALIAYQRQVQKLMIETIHQKNTTLTDDEIEEISDQINKFSCKDITDAIDAVNKSLKDITVRLDEFQKTIEEFVNPKTIEIEALKNKGIKIKGREEIIPAILEIFKQETKEFEFFEYKGYSHRIDELQEEDFAYFTKKIKVNHIIIPGFINAIKGIDAQPDNNNIYGRIDTCKKNNEDNWSVKYTTLWEDCQKFIRQNLPNVISSKIDTLYKYGLLIDKNKQLDENIKEYMKASFQIVETIVDLSVAICLTYLCEENVDVTAEDKEKINEYFECDKEFEIKLKFLNHLMNISALSTTTHTEYLISELLKLKEYFSNNGKLSKLCIELKQLQDDTNADVNQFDGYRTEKILTVLLCDYKFLVNYSLESIKGVEYHSIKKCDPKYIHYCSTSGAEKSKVKNKISDYVTFSHAVMLVNRKNEKRYLNLHPFVIDRNALKNVKESPFAISFFNFYNTCGKKLKYDVFGYVVPDSKSDSERPYNEFEYKKIADIENLYSAKNIEQHNINCLMESFEKIKTILTA